MFRIIYDDMLDATEFGCNRCIRTGTRDCHVNLIPVNEVSESPYKPSSPERIKRFIDILEEKSINVTVRRKLGSDIDASCGQLRLRKIKEPETL